MECINDMAMETRYSPKTIEPKWQKEWETSRLHETADAVPGKENYYQLVEFPYPSGNLHVGHWYAFTGPDIHARYMRMTGKNVLFPIGFDAFGLPAENAAIKRGLNPRVWTEENMAHMREQIASMGASFDRSREVVTCHPDYYKWTQWLFIQLWEKGLVEQRTTQANWCPSCKTILANEQVTDGKCERCGSDVAKKKLPQWQILITKYADRLIDDLDGLEWAEEIKVAQRNWIGRSEGALVKFQIANSKSQKTNSETEYIEVFTTRVDTIFGCTYVVVAPEHPLVTDLLRCHSREGGNPGPTGSLDPRVKPEDDNSLQIANLKEVEAYIEETKRKSDIERTDVGKKKTGVKLEGIEAINPFTGESVPVYVADYVLGSYGTGAVMAVPAHDARDFAFAKKHDLSIKQTIVPEVIDYLVIEKSLPDGASEEIKKMARLEVEKFVDEDWGHFWRVHVAHNKENDFLKFLSENIAEKKFYADSIGKSNFVVYPKVFFRVLTRDDFERFKVIGRSIDIPDEQLSIELKTFTDDGIVIDSGEFSGLSSVEAREKMTAWLEERGMGGKKTQYRLRDWTISRQRYWGVPIPLVHCVKCGWQAVPDMELPVVLPDIDDYLPREDGKSPLAKADTWVTTACPKCGSEAQRETDTMDTFVDSSWYFLRYADSHNGEAFASPEKLAAWMPVDFYSGGAEHVTMHLLYSRFFYKALFDLGLVSTSEPYVLRRNRGLIIGTDGNKMSKSKGNVLDPDEIVADLGADTMRLYLAFIGPYNEVGNYPWNPAGVVGVRRFLDRVWRAGMDVSDEKDGSAMKLTQRALVTVTLSLEQFKLNTGVAALMGCLNDLEKLPAIPKDAWMLFLRMLAPYAPHIAEELWHGIGNTESIFLASWPMADPAFLVDDEVTVVVSVNGKVRANIVVPSGSDETVVKAIALEHEKVKAFVEGKEIRKTVFVADKIINFVV